MYNRDFLRLKCYFFFLPPSDAVIPLFFHFFSSFFFLTLKSYLFLSYPPLHSFNHKFWFLRGKSPRIIGPYPRVYVWRIINYANCFVWIILLLYELIIILLFYYYIWITIYYYIIILLIYELIIILYIILLLYELLRSTNYFIRELYELFC